MADRWFESPEELVNAISSSPTEDVVQQVADAVEAILLKHIKSDIYGAYSPKPGAWVGGSTYARRHVLESNIKTTLEDDGTLVTTSDAAAGQCVVRGYTFSNADSGFLRLLESGHMGIWRNGFARPAVSNAQKEVDNSEKIRSILENGMRRVMNQ